MMMRTAVTVSLLGMYMALASESLASVETNSADGINSANLCLMGAGVSIGEVEARRPGKFGYDDGSHSNFGTIPTSVFIEYNQVTTTANNNAELLYSDPNTAPAHATEVAGVMISHDAAAPGVATGAALYASAGNYTTTPFVP